MLSTRRERQAAISIDAGVREWRWRERSGQRCDCTDAPLPRTRIHGDLAMNAGHFEQISDCWSSEQQPARYYRTAAARARRLQADVTTPRVKQYLDKMIAHCEGQILSHSSGASPEAPGDATTPRVKQYLDKMIAHCEGLAGKAEPGVSPGSHRRTRAGREW